MPSMTEEPDSEYCNPSDCKQTYGDIIIHNKKFNPFTECCGEKKVNAETIVNERYSGATRYSYQNVVSTPLKMPTNNVTDSDVNHKQSFKLQW